MIAACRVHRWIKALILGKTGTFAAELACTGRGSDDVREVTQFWMGLGLE